MWKEMMIQGLESPLKQLWNHARPYVLSPKLRVLKLNANRIEAKILQTFLNERNEVSGQLDPAQVQALAFQCMELLLDRAGCFYTDLRRFQVEWLSDLAFSTELRFKMALPSDFPRFSEEVLEPVRLTLGAFFYAPGDQMVGQCEWEIGIKPKPSNTPSQPEQ